MCMMLNPKRYLHGIFLEGYNNQHEPKGYQISSVRTYRGHLAKVTLQDSCVG